MTDEDPAGIGLVALFGYGADTVYLSPAPLYHSAPVAWCTNVQVYGGTVVVMERFDAEEALALIERHGVTLSQWVPTMFSRLLKLPDDVRDALRPVEPSPGHPRRGTVPGGGEAGDDRVVGTDPG